MPNNATLTCLLTLVWTDSTRYMYLAYETRLLAVLCLDIHTIHGLRIRIRILLTILLLTNCHCPLSLSPKYFNRARNLLVRLRQHPLFPRPQRAAISA